MEVEAEAEADADAGDGEGDGVGGSCAGIVTTSTALGIWLVSRNHTILRNFASIDGDWKAWVRYRGARHGSLTRTGV